MPKHKKIYFIIHLFFLFLFLQTVLAIQINYTSMGNLKYRFWGNNSQAIFATHAEWDFGDGKTATASNPGQGFQTDHTYAKPGTYTVRIQVYSTFFLPADNDVKQVKVKEEPGVLIPGELTLKVLNSPSDLVVGRPVSFQVEELTGSYFCKWGFGDGVVDSSFKNCELVGVKPGTTHSYDSPGTYNVSVDLRDLSGVNVGSASTSITISSKPPIEPPYEPPKPPERGVIPQITSLDFKSEVCDNESIEFRVNAIIADNDSVVFEFVWGDGSPDETVPGIQDNAQPGTYSAVKTHVYNYGGVLAGVNPHTYVGLVRARDQSGDGEYQTPFSITVLPASQCEAKKQVKADFSFESSPTNSYTFVFDASQSVFPKNIIPTLKWDFGDGSQETQQVVETKPVHGFKCRGTYPVTLTIETTFGSDSVTKNVVVSEDSPSCTSEDQAPIAKVMLRVISEGSPGTTNVSKVQAEKADSENNAFPVIARFQESSINTSKVSVNLDSMKELTPDLYKVIMSVNGLPLDIYYCLWNFGDEGEKSYYGILTGFGPLFKMPNAVWGEQMASYCPSENVGNFRLFRDGSLSVREEPYIVQVALWDINENFLGIFSSQPIYVTGDGNFTRDSNDSSLTNIALSVVTPQEKVIVGREIVFSARGIQEPSQKNCEWVFGDGSPELNELCSSENQDVTASHVYTRPSTYNVKLVVRDPLNNIEGEASISVNVKEESQTNQSITVNNSLSKKVVGFVPLEVEADFTGTYDPENCIMFTEIDWGDNSGVESFDQHCSSQPSPLTLRHTYTVLGTYTVTLTVGGKTQQSRDTAVVVAKGLQENQLPIADFSFTTTPGEKSVRFDASLSEDPDREKLTYEWDFGELGTRTSANPLLNFNFPDFDSYDVTLTVRDTKGGTASITKTVTLTKEVSEDLIVECTPNAVFTGDQTRCKSDFKPKTGERIVSISWSNGISGDTSNFGSNSGVFTYDSPGIYRPTVAYKIESIERDEFGQPLYEYTVSFSGKVKVIEPMEYNVLCNPDSGSEPLKSICSMQLTKGVLKEHHITFFKWSIGNQQFVEGYRSTQNPDLWDRVIFRKCNPTIKWCWTKTVTVTAKMGNIVEINESWWSGDVNLETLELKNTYFFGGTFYPKLNLKAYPEGTTNSIKTRSFNETNNGRVDINWRPVPRFTLSDKRGNTPLEVWVDARQSRDKEPIEKGWIKEYHWFFPDLEEFGVLEAKSKGGSGTSFYSGVGVEPVNPASERKGNQVISRKVVQQFNDVGTHKVSVTGIPEDKTLKPYTAKTKVYVSDKELTFKFPRRVNVSPQKIVLYANPQWKDIYQSNDFEIKWDFSDGTVFTGKKIEKVFSKAGRIDLNITAMATSPVEVTLKAYTYIDVIPPDFPDKTNSLYKEIGSSLKLYSNVPQGFSSKWLVNGQQVSTSSEFSYTFDKAGAYKVELVAMNEGEESYTVSKYYFVNDNGIIIKKTSSSKSRAPLLVSFEAELDEKTPADYEWSFGSNSKKIKGRQVQHVFYESGKYIVSVTARKKGLGEFCAEETLKAFTEIIVEPPFSIKNNLFVIQKHGNVLLEVDNPGFLKTKNPAKSDSFNAYVNKKLASKNPGFYWNLRDLHSIAFYKTFWKSSNLFGNSETPKHDKDFNVSLIVVDNNGAFRHTDRQVHVNGKPRALFTPNQNLEGNAPFKVEFDANESVDEDGNITSYQWFFGKEGTSTGKKATHVFTTHGNHEVVLRVTDNEGGISENRIVVSVNLSPKPSLSAFPVKGTSPLPVLFDASGSFDQDTPKGRITKWNWDFKDEFASNTGESQNISSQNFVNAKTMTLALVEGFGFNAKLRVVSTLNNKVLSEKNQKFGFNDFFVETFGEVLNAENQTISKGQKITGYAPLLAKFSASANYKDILDETEFVYEWSFDEENNSDNNAVALLTACPFVTHKFKKPGTYLVEVSVSGKVEKNVVRKEETVKGKGFVLVEVLNPLSVEIDKPVGTTPLTVNFSATVNDATVGFITPLVEWVFPDNEVKQGMQAQKTFSEPGVYKVKAVLRDTVTNEFVSDKEIIVIANSPEIFITTNPQLLEERVPFDVDFNAVATKLTSETESVVDYFWDFGDGATARERNVSHLFESEGEYVVELEIKAKPGTPLAEEFSGKAFVYVNALSPIEIETEPNPPVGRINSKNFLPSRREIDFTVNSFYLKDAPVLYQWNLPLEKASSVTHIYFGGGGNLQPIITVEDNNKAIAIADTNIFVNAKPVAVISDFTVPEQPVPVTIDFDASQSFDVDGNIVLYEWDFGDGETGEGEFVSHEYKKGGVMTLTLTVTDDRGGKSTTQKEIVVLEAPKPVFTATPLSGDAPLTVEFDASQSTDDQSIEFYTWDFGDGTSGSGIKVRHVFKEVGDYNVVLTVKDNDGLTAAAETKIIVKENKANSHITVETRPLIPVGIAPFKVEFIVHDTAKLMHSYEWDFGDGEKGTGEKIEHLFKEKGSYEVLLTVKNTILGDLGLDPVVKTIKVKVIVLSEEDSGNVSVNSFPSVGVAPFWAYFLAEDNKNGLWNFGDGFTSASGKVSHLFEKRGIFKVYYSNGSVSDFEVGSTKLYVSSMGSGSCTEICCSESCSTPSPGLTPDKIFPPKPVRGDYVRFYVSSADDVNEDSAVVRVVNGNKVFIVPMEKEGNKLVGIWNSLDGVPGTVSWNVFAETVNGSKVSLGGKPESFELSAQLCTQMKQSFSNKKIELFVVSSGFAGIDLYEFRKLALILLNGSPNLLSIEPLKSSSSLFEIYFYRTPKDYDCIVKGTSCSFRELEKDLLANCNVSKVDFIVVIDKGDWGLRSPGSYASNISNFTAFKGFNELFSSNLLVHSFLHSFAGLNDSVVSPILVSGNVSLPPAAKQKLSDAIQRVIDEKQNNDDSTLFSDTSFTGAQVSSMEKNVKEVDKEKLYNLMASVLASDRPEGSGAILAVQAFYNSGKNRPETLFRIVDIDFSNGRISEKSVDTSSVQGVLSKG